MCACAIFVTNKEKKTKRQTLDANILDALLFCQITRHSREDDRGTFRRIMSSDVLFFGDCNAIVCSRFGHFNITVDSITTAQLDAPVN